MQESIRLAQASISRVKNQPPGEQVYQCLECSRVLKRFGSLKDHLKIHLDNRPYPCVECGKRFRQGSHLKNHLRTHSKEKPYKCLEPGCLRSFSQAAGLFKHSKIHTGVRPYPCSHCAKSFRRSDTLQAHLVTHSDLRPYKCEECSETFSRKNALNRHRKLHEEKQHTCETCLKQFHRLDSLLVHQRTHTGERPYICPRDGCSSAFPTSTALKQHLFSHDEERKYACTFCEAKFKSKSSTLRHEREIHHPKRRFSCPECSMTFKRATTLRIHQNVHTPTGKAAFRQETRLAEFFRQKNVPFEWNQRMYICDATTGRVTSLQHRDEDGKIFYRPDFMFLSYLDRLIIVSCDEHEHNSVNYPWDCELTRMQKVMASLKISSKNGGYDPRPIQWIRFNPNAFKIDGRTARLRMHQRYEILWRLMQSGRTGLFYLFYSTTQGKLTHGTKYLMKKLDAHPTDEENIQTMKQMMKEAIVINF